MAQGRESNGMPRLLRGVTVVECLVVGATALILFFAPTTGADVWAWAPAPFNARYIGAVYFAALVPLLIFVIAGRWDPGWMLLWRW